jgi:hypothetical protein
MKLKIQEIAYHRNGVCGEGFHVIRFQWKDDDSGTMRNMVAIYFGADENEFNPRCAVLDADETAAGNIGFANGNSWRGDHFSDDLRKAIAERNAARV